MAHITIEYMIFIPVLIAQIFLFPLVATTIMNTYTDSRRTLELQEIAGSIGSSIQQLYYTMNHGSISNSTMKINLEIPPLIEGLAYTTTLCHVTHSDTSYEVMNVTLHLIGTKDQSSTLVTLGQNVDWQDNLAFNSTAHSLCMAATKTGNSIWLSFGGSN
jgi:hypothetical protein